MNNDPCLSRNRYVGTGQTCHFGKMLQLFAIIHVRSKEANIWLFTKTKITNELLSLGIYATGTQTLRHRKFDYELSFSLAPTNGDL